MKSIRILSFLILSGCTNKSEKAIDQASRIDSLKFPLQNPVEINNLIDSVATEELDSLSKVKWTDKIMPVGLIAMRLYSARYLAKYNSVGTFRVFGVSTRADDWGKSFLITSDKDQNLIDYVMIANSYGDAADDGSGHQTVVSEETWTKTISDSDFNRITINEEINFYGEENEINHHDSIIARITINSKGKFEVKKIDSVRSEKKKKVD